MSRATTYVPFTHRSATHKHKLTTKQIKYLRVPDEIIDLVKDQQQGQQNNGYRGGRNNQRGGGDRGRGGRGGGRGGRGGRGRGQ